MPTWDGKDAGEAVRNGLMEIAKAIKPRECLHSWMKPYHIGELPVQECKHCFMVRRI